MNYKKILDDIFPKNHLIENKKRYTVRALLINENKIGLLHINGLDPLFGMRNHLETPGGGIDKGETPIEALKRELLEETGFEIEKIEYVTTISVDYNLLNRRDVSKIFACKVKNNTHKTNLLEYEKSLIKSFDFYDLDTIEKTYEKYPIEGVYSILYKRDIEAIRLYKKMRKI